MGSGCGIPRAVLPPSQDLSVTLQPLDRTVGLLFDCQSDGDRRKLPHAPSSLSEPQTAHQEGMCRDSGLRSPEGTGGRADSGGGPLAPALFLPVGLTMAFLQNRPTLPLASAFPGSTVSDPAMKTLSRALSLTQCSKPCLFLWGAPAVEG